MPQKTGIEWTDYSSNAFYVTRKDTGKRGWHYVHASEGCRFCYAEVINKRFGTGLEYKAGHAANLDFHLNEKELTAILKLNTRLAKKGETAKMFVGDMTDLFADWVPDEHLDKLFAVFALCPNITFQLLTKRAEWMREYFDRLATAHAPDGNMSLSPLTVVMGEYIKRFSCKTEEEGIGILNAIGREWPLPNVWLGVSVEDQKTADERIPLLLQTPAAVRWVSAEPLLGAIDFTRIGPSFEKLNRLTSHQEAVDHGTYENRSGIDWIVAGGESGPGARPCDLAWIRSIVAQCKAASVPVFVKQLGAKPVTGRRQDGSPKAALFLKSRKGSDMSEWPEDLRVRQMPA